MADISNSSFMILGALNRKRIDINSITYKLYKQLPKVYQVLRITEKRIMFKSFVIRVCDERKWKSYSSES